MLWYQDFDRRMQGSPIRVLQEESMSAHTTFRIGGPARRMAVPGSAEEVRLLLELAEEHRWPTLILGGGSNLLVSDQGIDRLVIATAGLRELCAEGETLTAGAGVRLSRLAAFAAERGLGGLSFAQGIPGTVGGAVFMNAGAYGGEMAQVVERVTAWLPDRGVCTLPREELGFAYRHSRFSEGEGVVLAAELRLEGGRDPAELQSEMEELRERRRQRQPLELPSAGSTFKRPVGHYAGTLIESCGLKGLQVGGAQVSEKHAGFVVNRGGASCADVLALMEEVQRRVYEETGVRLEPEVRAVGPD